LPKNNETSVLDDVVHESNLTAFAIGLQSHRLQVCGARSAESNNGQLTIVSAAGQWVISGSLTLPPDQQLLTAAPNCLAINRQGSAIWADADPRESLHARDFLDPN
jgi:hypothetical protein